MRSIKNGAESYQDSFFLKDIESDEVQNFIKLEIEKTPIADAANTPASLKMHAPNRRHKS